MAADRIVVAQIGAAHGIRGEVRLFSFTGDPLAVTAYGPLETEDGSQSFEIEAVRAAKDHLVAQLRGVNDRDAAERLRNLKLYVPRSRLPPPQDEEYYHTDLIGLAVIARDGGQLGTVVAIQNYGAGDLIEIAPATGGSTVMLPFTDRTVPVVDIAAGRLVVELPEGLLSGK
jgi:16S rRNA processing protein RimM